MNIREVLQQGKPILFDGAMGTYFSKFPDCGAMRCEMGNLEMPDIVAAIHNEYLAAGCRAIKTNTFSVGMDVAKGDIRLAEQMINAGCEIALACAGPYDAQVFADIGPAPFGVCVQPEENYITQGKFFLSKGIRAFLLETQYSYTGIAEFADWLKVTEPDSFLMVSFAVGPDGFTRDGCSGEELFSMARANEHIDMVGFNCFSGPYHMLRFLQSLDIGSSSISVMPNAGYPTVSDRRTIYRGTPEYFAQTVEQMMHCGAIVVGGCCGTTPEHIAALRESVEKFQPITAGRESVKLTRTHQNRTNHLWSKLESGRRVIAVEFDSPRDDRIEDYLEGVQKLKDAGIDALTIADCPVGVPRVDSSLLACKINREFGIDVLPHMTCRDRNLNATKALLLGLSVEGIHNVLLVTGDPLPSAARDEVKSVFNCNSRKLARYVSSMNEECMAAPFRIFAALNINAMNFDNQLKLAREKEENGVVCFLTQPVLSERAMTNLKLARQTLSTKLLGGILPVVSYRNACFMNNEIAGIHVSDEICEMYRGKDREEAEELALQLSVKIAGDIRPFTDGIYLMTPFNRVELMCRILDAIKE